MTDIYIEREGERAREHKRNPVGSEPQRAGYFTK